MSSPRTGRIQRGRGHSYFLDGEPVPGVTTILDRGVPKPALVNWAARETAGYACDHWQELEQLGTADRMRRLEGARFERSKAAAARGTDVHALAARLAAGEELEVPEALVAHVDAYLEFVRAWRVEELLVEVPVFSRRWRYAGTPDLIAKLGDGRTWLLDWKTSASGIFPETALQLAAYAHAELYLDGAGDEHPMPAIDASAAVWLRADGADLVPVNTSTEIFRTFLHAAVVARFTEQPREHLVRAALSAPTWLDAEDASR